MTAKNDTLDYILQRIASGPKPAILSHPSPDGDSVGSSVALWHLLNTAGIESFVAIPGPIPRRYEFLVQDINPVPVPLDLSGMVAIVLDCSDEHRLSRIGQSLNQAALVVNLDHHRGNTRFGHLNHVDPSASAVGELIYTMFCPGSIPQPAAQALFTAIYTDTGRFSFSNTSARALEIASRLVAQGAAPNEIYHQVYQNRSPGYYRFLAKALDRIELLFQGKVALVVLDRPLLDAYGIADWDLEGFEEYPRGLAGVEIAGVVREQPDGSVKLSLRSRGSRDVAAIARELGGGGHVNAAGAQMDLNPSQVVERLKHILAGEMDGND